MHRLQLPQVAQAKQAQASARKVFEQAREASARGDAANAKRLYQSVHHTVGSALKAAPDAAESLLMDAEAMLHIGLHADVIQTTGRLLKIRPDSLDGFLLRGKAYLYQGDTEVAMKHFKEGYKSDPDHKGLKKAYKSLKDYQKLSDKAFGLKGRHKECLEKTNDALKLLHGEV
eukprot:SAG31_NODE_106_length_24954_cov_17.726413_8_plen_173_part_00